MPRLRRRTRGAAERTASATGCAAGLASGCPGTTSAGQTEQRPRHKGGRQRAVINKARHASKQHTQGRHDPNMDTDRNANGNTLAIKHDVVMSVQQGILPARRVVGIRVSGVGVDYSTA